MPIRGVVFFLAHRMRRVNCKRCGVTVEMVPWCDGKDHLTTTYRWYLATRAKRLSWGEVGSTFRTSWDGVCRAVGRAVEWGPAHRDLSGLTAPGVDEIARAKGHTYVTPLYDISGQVTALAAQLGRDSMASDSTPCSLLGPPARQLVRHLARQWLMTGIAPPQGVKADVTGIEVHLVADQSVRPRGIRPRSDGPGDRRRRPPRSASGR